MASLKGKLVVITGAGSGIGRATATILASHGVLLSLADKNETALAAVKQELEGRYGGHNSGQKDTIFTAAIDIRSQEACNTWIHDTVAYFGQPIAGAANIAGVIGPNMAKETGSIRNITDDEFDFVVGVNVKGALNSLRAELPHMQEGTKGRGGGAIVNTASIAGLIGVLYNVPYVASKHAIAGITRTLTKEEGGRAIRVNAIAPGIIDTPLLTQFQAAQDSDGVSTLFGEGLPGALGRLGDAEEVANLVVFLLSPESSFINGVVVPIEGGMLC